MDKFRGTSENVPESGSPLPPPPIGDKRAFDVDAIRGLFGQPSPQRGKVRPRSGEKKGDRTADKTVPTIRKWADGDVTAPKDEGERASEMAVELCELKRALARSTELERKLRAVVTQLQSSLASRDRELQEVANFIKGKGPAPVPTAKADNSVERKLRVQVGNMEKLLRQKEEEIERLNQDCKISTLKEAQNEAKEYLTEVQRLRLLLYELNKTTPAELALLRYEERVGSSEAITARAGAKDSNTRLKSGMKAGPKKKQRSKSSAADIVKVPLLVPFYRSDFKKPFNEEDKAEMMEEQKRFASRTENMARKARSRKIQEKEKEVEKMRQNVRTEERVFQKTRDRWVARRKRDAALAKKAREERVQQIDQEFEQLQQKKAVMRRLQELQKLKNKGEIFTAAQNIQKVYRGYIDRKLIAEAKDYIKSQQGNGNQADSADSDAYEKAEAMNAELEDLRLELLDKHQETEELIERCRELEEANGSLGTECEDFKYEVVELRSRISELSQQMEVLTKRGNCLENTNKELKNMIAALQSSSSEEQQLGSESYQSLMAMVTQLEEKNKRITELEHECSSQNAKLARYSQLEEENTQLKHQLREARLAQRLNDTSNPEQGEESIRVPQGARGGDRQKRYKESGKEQPNWKDKRYSKEKAPPAHPQEQLGSQIKTEDSTQDVIPTEMPVLQDNGDSDEETEGKAGNAENQALTMDSDEDGFQPDPALVEQLTEMSFSKEMAEKALREASNNPELAAEFLLTGKKSMVGESDVESARSSGQSLVQNAAETALEQDVQEGQGSKNEENAVADLKQAESAVEQDVQEDLGGKNEENAGADLKQELDERNDVDQEEDEEGSLEWK